MREKQRVGKGRRSDRNPDGSVRLSITGLIFLYSYITYRIIASCKV